MSLFDEIRHAFVWSSCTGVEERGRQFDEFLRDMLEQVFESGVGATLDHWGGRTETIINPYRKEENA